MFIIIDIALPYVTPAFVHPAFAWIAQQVLCVVQEKGTLYISVRGGWSKADNWRKHTPVSFKHQRHLVQASMHSIR